MSTSVTLTPATTRLAPASVAVVVVAWQDHDELDVTLDALARQSVSGFEVIVADNGAGLAERLADWVDAFPLRHLDLGANLGPSAARNAAAATTDAELLLFLDDDAIPEPDWVEAFVGVMSATGARAARGRVRAKDGSVYNELARAYDLGEVVRPAIINTEGNCCVRADAYAAVGGFDEDMFGHEGAELSHRLLDGAGPDAIVYTPHAVIQHDYVDGLAGYLRKRYRHGAMLRHVDPAITRWAAGKARRRSPWTPRRVAMVPVKVLGIAAECAGFAGSARHRNR